MEPELPSEEGGGAIREKGGGAARLRREPRGKPCALWFRKDQGTATKGGMGNAGPYGATGLTGLLTLELMTVTDSGEFSSAFQALGSACSGHRHRTFSFSWSLEGQRWAQEQAGPPSGWACGLC